MKTFAVVLICAILAVGTLAGPTPEAAAEPASKASEKNPGHLQYDPAHGFDNSELLRQRKWSAPAYAAPAAPAYAPSSLSYSAPAPSIPCSKAIIVSCAPSVQPAPCSAPPAAY